MIIEHNGKFAFECDRRHCKTDPMPTVQDAAKARNLNGDMLSHALAHGVDARGKPDENTHICCMCRAMYGFLF